jgi:tungstate transport system ATP-binding protein
MSEALPMDIIYRITNLIKSYDGRNVLSIQNLDILEREILSIVGPSGSGKSTLLRMLNFLEFPTSGQIEFLGSVFTAGQGMSLAQRRRVTTVFQKPVLLNRSVKDNVSIGLKLQGMRDQSGSSVLAEVGLEKLANQRARTLSGGEAQRVALARAMALNPDILLLDEPTANLDPYNVALIENIIKRLNHVRGVTIVLVTHNVFQAKRLADRVAFIMEGNIVEINQTESLFKTPQDPRTQAFLRGDMVY